MVDLTKFLPGAKTPAQPAPSKKEQAVQDYSKLSDEELLAQYRKMSGTSPVAGGDIDYSKLSDEELKAQYERLQPKPMGYGEDIAKSAGTGLVHAGTGMLTTVPDMMDLAQRAGNWAGSKVAGVVGAEQPDLGINPEAEANTSVDLRNPTVNKLIEDKITGPLHQAQTWPGAIAQKGIEYGLPSVVGGGGSTMAKILRGWGAGLGAEGAGAIADATGNEDYGAAARMAGGMLGYKLPQKITSPGRVPNTPLAQAQLSRAQQVEGAGGTQRAGQFTGNPWQVRMESNIDRLGGTPEKYTPEGQAAQASEILRQQGGVTGSGISNVQDIQDTRARAQAQYNNMLPQARALYDQPFQDRLFQIRRELGQDTSNLRRGVYTPSAAHPMDPQRPIPGFENHLDDIKYGPMDPQNPAARTSNVQPGMSGVHYDNTRDGLEGAIDKTKDPNIKDALTKTRDALDDMWERNVQPQFQGAAPAFRQQSTDLDALETAASKRGKSKAAGEIKPDDVFQAHEDQTGSMANLSRAMESTGVGKDIPETNPWFAGPYWNTVGALGGALAGHLSHVPGEAFTGTIGGMMAAPAAAQIAAKVLAKPYYWDATQAYLKNQAWPDARNMSKVLSGPGVKIPLPALLAPQFGGPQDDTQ